MSREWENWNTPSVVAAIQDHWTSAEFEKEHREILADLAISHGASSASAVLEVGSGTGLVYQQLMKRSDNAVSYTGVDVTLEMLRKARASFPEGRFIYGDGYNLIFRDGEVDLVLCFEVLGHVGEVRPMIRELLRITKHTCIFTVWPSGGDAIVEVTEKIDGISFLHRDYSDQYIREAIEKAGRAFGEIESVTSEQLKFGHVAYIIKKAQMN